MKINTALLLKKELKKEYKVIVETLSGERVHISCKGRNQHKGDHNRKAFIFPKQITIDEQFIEGIALYLGDGDFHRIEKNHTTFSSKDKDIVRHYLDFLRKYFLIKNEDVSFILRYKKENIFLKEEWGKVLDINPLKFLTYHAKRNKEETGNIQVNGLIFRKLFECIIQKIIFSGIFKKKSLRRAFLRGIFAAEGSVGIDREEKSYIVQIAFSTGIHEKILHKLIQTALEQEEIRFRTDYGINDNSCDIIITNWKYYLKLWDIDLFSMCKRKKDGFEEIAKKLEIYLELEEKFRNSFFRSIALKQKIIAKLIDSWQGNVSKAQAGIILLRVEQIKILIPYSSCSKERILSNTKNMRVGSLTKIKPNKTSIKFLKQFKSF